jgi:UPF0042 nucleotide-binding protein
MEQQTQDLQIVLITGMSGSGKSVALHALEDSGFFCVDNLPPELLEPFVALERTHHATRLAIAVDARTATALPALPAQLAGLRQAGVRVTALFRDATTGTLVRRYSETRRRHPLSQPVAQADGKDQRRAVVDAIELERGLLEVLRAQSHVIDTSLLRPTQLQAYVKEVMAAASEQLTLVFESFAFKRGVPRDADFVFDVRMLPNPHYEPELRALTGRDAPVAAFLQAHADVAQMLQDIEQLLRRWLPPLAQDHRSYVTVAIGCTGGQHRSVYLVEQLVARFASSWATLTRHRELDGTH